MKTENYIFSQQSSRFWRAVIGARGGAGFGAVDGAAGGVGTGAGAGFGTVLE